MGLKETTISKASKGLILQYYNTSKSLTGKKKDGISSVFNVDKVLEAVRKDSTVMAALNTLVDKSVEAGWRVTGLDGKSKKTGLEKELKKLRFSKLLRQILYNLYAYNNVFIELVKNGKGTVKELHVLETTTTKPVADEHGKIIGYVQETVDNKDPIFWSPDEVVHVAVAKLTTSVWGELDIQAVYTSVLIKQYIYSYLGWLFGTNQFKGFYNIKNANETQIKSFISYLKRSEADIEKPVIAEGEIEYQILRDFTDGDSILNLINQCDNNILTLLQVPPVLMGKPGDSNRSNSDAQKTALYTRIKSIQELLKDSFTNDLFPLMNYDKTEFHFNPLNYGDLTTLLEQAERMVNIGFKKDKIQDYLELQGFPLEGDLFAEDEHMTQPTKSEDMFPSRRRKPEDETSKEIGTGEESTTREDQLVSKSHKKDTFYFSKKESEDESIKERDYYKRFW